MQHIDSFQVHQKDVTATTSPGECQVIDCNCHTSFTLCNSGTTPLSYSKGDFTAFVKESFEDCGGYYDDHFEGKLVSFASFQHWGVRLHFIVPC